MPGVGRFAGEDWIKGEIYSPTSLNQYGYCLGNPLTLNNCDENARRWMETGGIRLETEGHIAPNLIYDYNVGQINIGRKVKYVNSMYGDLYDIWNKLHSQYYFVHEDKKCITSD